MTNNNEMQSRQACLKMATTLGTLHAYEDAATTKEAGLLLPAAVAGSVAAPTAMMAVLAPKDRRLKYTGIAALSGASGLLGGAGGGLLAKALKVNPLLGALVGGGALTSITALGLRGKEIEKKTVDLEHHTQILKRLHEARNKAESRREQFQRLFNNYQVVSRNNTQVQAAQDAIARLVNASR